VNARGTVSGAWFAGNKSSVRALAIGLKATGSTAAPSSNHASAGALVTWKTPTQTRKRSLGAALGCSTTSITEPFGNLWATHTGIALCHYHKTRFIVVSIRKIIDSTR